MIGNQDFRIKMAEQLAGAANAALDEGKNLADGSQGIGPLGHLKSSDYTWSQPFFNGQSKWGESAGSMEQLLNFLGEDLSAKTSQGLKDSIKGVLAQTDVMHGNQNYDGSVIATAKANIEAALAEIKTIKTKAAEKAAEAQQATKDALKTTTAPSTTTVETTKVATTQTKQGTAPAAEAEAEKTMTAGGAPDEI